jgi:hypothetical protein
VSPRRPDLFTVIGYWLLGEKRTRETSLLDEGQLAKKREVIRGQARERRAMDAAARCYHLVSVFRLWVSVIYALRLLPAACRWNDTVHTQILDHLSVVIEAMSWGKRCQEQARGRPATT